MTVYEEKLNAVVQAANEMPGTSGAAALRKVVLDLEGDGPIGALLFSLDAKHFNMVVDLLQEFRRTGRNEPFNSLHAHARARLAAIDI